MLCHAGCAATNQNGNAGSTYGSRDQYYEGLGRLGIECHSAGLANLSFVLHNSFLVSNLFILIASNLNTRFRLMQADLSSMILTGRQRHIP